MRFKSSIPFISSTIFISTTTTESFVINNNKFQLVPTLNFHHHDSFCIENNNCKRIIQGLLFMGTNDIDNTNKKGKVQKKKRRFAQDVEPIVSIQTPKPKPKPKRNPFQQKRDTFSSDDKVRTNSKSLSNNNDNQIKNPMLQNSKSIEELESIMLNRWGTRLEKWTADFDEWEVVYDDDNSQGNQDTDNRGELNLNTSLKSGKKVRSKPVLNPWDKVEKQKSYEKSKDDDGNSQDTNASVFKSAKDRQNSVLERVRKNQERFKLQKGGQEGDTNEKGKYDEEYETELDFYDEDDEGYEGTGSYDSVYDDDDEDLENEATDFYSNIISPKPVGGPGSSRGFQSNDSNNERGGFFFKELKAPVSVSEDNSEKNQKKVNKKEPEKKVAVKPMLDIDGREMFLTLEQAAQNADVLALSDNQDDLYDIVQNDNESSWEDIGITNPQLVQNLNKMNCFKPLSVQDKACPSIVSGNDVLISTHTGSGKTLAFLAPLAQRLLFDAENDDGDDKLGVKVIVIAPGRELASQIVAVARDLFKGTELSAMLAIGGTPFSRNFEQFRKQKPTFLIGTPGRIAELVVGRPGDKTGKLKVASLQTIVLDECDALLDYEPHKEPTAAIMSVLKRRHRDSLQSILCSATAGDLMATSKIDGYLRETFAHAQSDEDDQSITAASDDGQLSRTRVSRTAIHGVVHVPHRRFALDTVRRILYTDPSPQQVLIFVDNSRRVGIVVDKLAEMDIVAAPLHGGQGSEKGDRAEVNKALRDGFVGIVVATEMAARGIDAPYLTHVINLDLPTDASHYAHRAGRCGRGGRPGVVVNIAVGKKEQNVPKKFAKALNIEMYEAEPQGGKLVIIDSKANGKIEI